MTKSKKLGVQITKRDEGLFRYLFVNKVATNSQIKEGIFNNASKQAVHRRLDKLISAGFLEANYIRQNNNRLIYSLSKKALLNFIGGRSEMKRLQRKSASIFHDLGLVEIKRKLSGIKSIESYMTENLLVSGLFDDDEDVKSIRTINPDAILQISISENKFYFPLEYEASAKFAKRYDSLMSKYYLMDEVKAVLFISKCQSLQDKVMRAERKKCKDRPGKFFYCLYENVLEHGEESQFTNFQNQTLKLN